MAGKIKKDNKEKVSTDKDRPEQDKYQKLVDHCLGLYKQFKESNYRKSKIAEIEAARKVYEQKSEKTNYPWKDAANYVMPLTTIAIDNLEPRLVSGLIGIDPIVAFDVEGKKDEITETLENEFNKELKNVIKIKDFAIIVAHTILNEGTHYTAIKYDIDKKKIKEFVFDQTGRIVIDEEKKEATVEEKEITVFEGGKFEQIPFTDIYCADNLSTQADWEREPICRVIRPTYAELMKKQDDLGYMNIGEHLLAEEGGKKIPVDKRTPAQKIEGVEITGKEIIESLEFHLPYYMPLDREDDQDDGEKPEDFEEEQVIVTIALKSETVYRIVKQSDINYNNERVIKRIRMNPEAGRSFGTSLYGKIRALQDGCSDLFNQMINVATLIMIPYFFYEEKAGLKDKIELFPGQGVPVDSVDGIKFPSVSINPAAFMQFVNFFVSLWERSTSISDSQIGRLADRKETATAILTAVQEGGIKHNYQAEIFKEEFLACLDVMYDLYYKNMPYDKTITFQGKKVLYPRQEMRRPFKFRLTGSTEKANKLISRKESEDLMTMFRDDPMMDQLKLRKDVIKNYGKDNAEEYVNPQVGQVQQALMAFPQLVPKVMEMAKQLAQQAGAGKRGGGQQKQPQTGGNPGEQGVPA